MDLILDQHSYCEMLFEHWPRVPPVHVILFSMIQRAKLILDQQHTYSGTLDMQSAQTCCLKLNEKLNSYRLWIVAILSRPRMFLGYVDSRSIIYIIRPQLHCLALLLKVKMSSVYIFGSEVHSISLSIIDSSISWRPLNSMLVSRDPFQFS